MVDFFIATAQALSLAALVYGAYFVLLRGPQLARTPDWGTDVPGEAGSAGERTHD